MPIRLTCPGCQKTMIVPDNVSGKSIRCKSCSHVLAVPSASSSSHPTGELIDLDEFLSEISKTLEQIEDFKEVLESAPVSLSLKAVVKFGKKKRDGHVIAAIAPAWEGIIPYLKEDFSKANQIPPRKWEEIIAASYLKAGFDEVILTPQSGDFGRDVIAIKHDIVTVRVIDQVKAYRPGHLVTAEEVRALIGVMLSDRNATHAVMTTTSGFAPRLTRDPGIKCHLPNRLILINGETLLERLCRLFTDPK
jgi:restriction system protein